MFVAGIAAIALDAEGDRILDAMEEAHGLGNMHTPDSPARQYEFTQFNDHAEAIAWLEAQALTFNEDAAKHVQFGVPQ